MRIIETIYGVHRIEDFGEDRVEWLEAHDTWEGSQRLRAAEQDHPTVTGQWVTGDSAESTEAAGRTHLDELPECLASRQHLACYPRTNHR